jgi:hypothetical protein
MLPDGYSGVPLLVLPVGFTIVFLVLIVTVNRARHVLR